METKKQTKEQRIEETNQQNGWVICGLEQAQFEAGKFIVGTNPKISDIVGEAQTQISDAIRNLRLANEMLLFELRGEE